MKSKLIAVVFLLTALSVACIVNAGEYGNYDFKRLLTVSETSSGKTHGIDRVYLDQILHDLSTHAGDYPPKFDTPQDKERAIRDTKMLSGMCDILINNPAPNPALLIRAARVNAIGHNLDIVGAAEKADAIFQRLLTLVPSDPQSNYLYGIFLAGSGKPKEALPYLEKALAAGYADAAYSIGITYLTLGDKEQALKNLEDFKRRKPDDTQTDKLIDALRNGKIEIKNRVL